MKNQSSQVPTPKRPERIPEFTFDDWSNLYQSNPEAFEARRQAVLAIELSRLGPRGARARICLSNLEKAMEGKGGHERATISFRWMTDSASQLQDRLTELSERLAKLQSELQGLQVAATRTESST